MGEQFLRHSLAISQAWAALKASTRDSDYVRDPGTPRGRPIPVLPDAYFQLSRGDGLVRSYFLEIDLGTHVLGRLRRKLRGLELYRAEGFQRRFEAETFTVLIVAESAGRLEGLLRAARAVVASENQGRYLFGMAELPRPERILVGPWTSIDGEPRPLP